jgi:GT2 family glycosyltransferase
LPANIGFARGFNAALAYAMRQGADFIFMLNNDTVVDAETVGNLAAAAQAEPRAGIVVPKIYYFDQPEVVWSAGSRFRRFPPAVVLRRTAGADDGRYDRELNLEFTTTCALLLRRSLIEDVGLLDPNFFILYDDYDLSLRAREQGYLIRFAPDAHLRHKVSKSTAVGAPNPFYWFHYGRSAMIFCRKHQRRRLMTGPWHRWYVILRFLAEGKHFGLRPFLKGLRAGRTATLLPVPRWDDATVDRGAIVRESPQTDK